MKNIINYYYNFNIINLRNIKNNFYFNYNNESYILYLINYKVNLNYVFNLLNAIPLNNYFHKILKNRNNEFLTYDGTNYYILMKIVIKYNRNINIMDLIMFSNISLKKDTKLPKLNWIELWIKKIDYLEYYINNKESIRDDVKICFNYFVGLGENAIIYVKKAFEYKKNNSDTITIAHNRINPDSTLYDLYNPFNLVIDYKSRDIAEYLKGVFFEGNYDIRKITRIISSIELDEFETKILFGRLLFPTFFFDLLDSVEIEKINTNEIIYIYDRVKEYESFLNLIFNLINKNNILNNILWIKK